jgi:hypothetical protein
MNDAVEQKKAETNLGPSPTGRYWNTDFCRRPNDDENIGSLESFKVKHAALPQSCYSCGSYHT